MDPQDIVYLPTLCDTVNVELEASDLGVRGSTGYIIFRSWECSHRSDERKNCSKSHVAVDRDVESISEEQRETAALMRSGHPICSEHDLS